MFKMSLVTTGVTSTALNYGSSWIIVMAVAFAHWFAFYAPYLIDRWKRVVLKKSTLPS
jgi:hypothetical protein